MEEVARTTSIIADSTISSSSPTSTPSNLPDRGASTHVDAPLQVKRATRTYGRPKTDANASDALGGSPVSRARILKTAPRDAETQVIPESDDVDEHGSSFDGYDWKAKLKAIDESYDGSDEFCMKEQPTKSAVVSRENASNTEKSFQPPAASSLSGFSHSSSVDTDQLAGTTLFAAVGENSLFSGSQCNLLVSDLPSDSSFPSQGHDPPSNGEIGEPSKITRRPRKRAVTSPESSDSENTSPKHPYAINSPEKLSSPTPPTSPFTMDIGPNKSIENEEDSADDADVHKLSEISGPARKGKGKEPEKRSTRRKKAPTKKEVLETRKENARLLADQHVSIRRNHPESVHTVANLFNKLRNAPKAVVRQDLDPIMSFSSPGRLLSESFHIAASEDATRADQSAPESSSMAEAAMSNSGRSGSASEAAEKLGHDVLDDDMPDPDAVLCDYEEKRQQLAREKQEIAERERRARELQDRKRRALDLSKTQSTSKGILSRSVISMHEDSDSDDGLEIVEDMISLPVIPQRHLGKDVKPIIQRSDSLLQGNTAGKRSASRRTMVSQRSLELASRPIFVSAQDKNGSKRRAGEGVFVSHNDLNNLILQRANKQSDVIEEKKKDQWVRAGGTLKDQKLANSPGKTIKDWLDKGSAREDFMKVDEQNYEGHDEGNSECTLGEKQECGIERSNDEVCEPGAPDNDGTATQQMEISDDEQSADTDKENHRPALRRQPARLIVDTDEEDDGDDPSQPRAHILVPDTSFVEEDLDSPGEDKENSAELAFDLGEDKENAIVPRHVPRGRVLATNSVPPSPGRSLDDNDQAARKPLSSLDGVGEGIFTLPLAQRQHSIQGRVLQVLHEEERQSTIAPVTTRKTETRHRRMSSVSSIGSVGERGESPTPFSGEGFSQLFAKSDNNVREEELGPATAIGEGSFSQFFSAEPSLGKEEDKSLFRLDTGPAERNNEFQFTQPNTLLPSVRISESQRREVDEMFCKDQEFKLDEAKRWREEDKSSEAGNSKILSFQQFTPSQLTQLSPQSIRRPLETLSLDSGEVVSQLELIPENVPHTNRRRLLRERPKELIASPGPPPAIRNAFDVLRDAAAKKGEGKEGVPKIRLEESEFVEAEAQESDEEAMLGFGGGKDDEESGDEDPNAVVDGLVDDTPMDAKTEAVDLVLERHKVHQEEDDAYVEKLHKDAVAGKLRAKRRDRGLGFEDSESDDEEYRGPRKPFSKKRRVEGDTLESYGQNPETRAFYDTYQAELAEEVDPGLAHLTKAESESNQEEEGSNGEEPETIDPFEVRRRIRELSKNELSLTGPQMIRPMDDDEEEVADGLQVEERPFRARKLISEVSTSSEHLDYRGTFKRRKVQPAEQSRLKNWASEEARMNSASGRGGFVRKEEGTSRKRRGTDTRSKVPDTGGGPGGTTKSSLLSRMEKRRGFEG